MGLCYHRAAMKIIRFADAIGQVHWGRVHNDAGPLTLAELCDGDPLSGLTPRATNVSVQRVFSPLNPANVLCIGLNYRRHADESGATYPERPILFVKPTTTVIGHDAPVVLPRAAQSETDYECELAVVIGKSAKNVAEADALDYVLGYTCANDVSARDWQLRLDRQWARGKGFDTFCPLGPVLVTKDEIADPDALAITMTLNGEIVQSSNTSDMIFSVRQIISYLSQGMTLVPGTVILTGTPEGVGMARTPPRFLRPGDVCEVTIAGIGTLRNGVAAEA